MLWEMISSNLVLLSSKVKKELIFLGLEMSKMLLNLIDVLL